MKKLGVIGGLGPIATVYYLQLVTQMSEAESDQEHIEILMHSAPYIPDRTNYILGKSDENPLPGLLKVLKELENLGAQEIAIPCITAHHFHEDLQKETKVPIIHGVEETIQYLKEAQIHKVGIMATDGTRQSRLFFDALQREHMIPVIPSPDGQKGVMDLIYNQVKAGKKIDLNLFKKISAELFSQGAEVILLGCTELSLIKRDYDIGPGFLDVLEILARESVKRCGTLKPEYDELITKA